MLSGIFSIIKIQTEFAQIISVHLEKLIQKNVYYSRDPLAVSHYQLLMAAQTFRQQKGNMPRSTAIFIESEFAITMFLAQALSLLINVSYFFKAFRDCFFLKYSMA